MAGLALFAVTGQSDEAKVITAQVYEAGSHHQKLLYRMRRDEVTAGPVTKITEVFTDPSGVEATHSETTLSQGKFQSYIFDQKQLGDHAKIEARDGKLFFEYTQKSGKTKKDDEKFAENFVIGTIMGRLVEARWKDFLDGHDIDLRFGVPDRAETVGFKFFKDHEEKLDGRDVIVAKMKPSSFIIAAAVKPLFFYYDKATGHLVEFRGRTIPKLRDGDDWKDLDAETVYGPN